MPFPDTYAKLAPAGGINELPTTVYRQTTSAKALLRALEACVQIFACNDSGWYYIEEVQTHEINKTYSTLVRIHPFAYAITLFAARDCPNHILH